jgi:hypothetical protein
VWRLALLALVGCATPVASDDDGSAALPAPAVTGGGIAFVDVAVVTMETPQLLEIERLPPTKDGERIYRLCLAIDRVATGARITLEGPGMPRVFRISSTTRPVVRTYKRR